MAKDGESLRLPLSTNGTGQGLILVSLSMLALGVVMVYSASFNLTPSADWMGRVEIRHLVYAILAAVVLGLMWRIDYRLMAVGRTLPVMASGLLAFSFFLCVLVLIPGVGAEVNYARRWLFLPGPVKLSFQPSELMKLSLVVFLACWLGRMDSQRVRSFKKTFIPAMLLIGACVGVVIIEDFGTAMVIALSAVAVLLLAGVPWYYLLVFLPLATVVGYVFVWNVPYRMTRVTTFLQPQYPWDTTMEGTYQPRQALIAIGSGGLMGKGLGKGGQKLGYLPEDSTDYIFAIICEELGFVGAALLLGLILTMLYLTWRASTRSRNPAGRLIAGGLGLVIGLQALGHIAVNIAIVPPKGMSLPLVSAGGTGLLLLAGAVAAIVSVTAHPEDPRDPHALR